MTCGACTASIESYVPNVIQGVWSISVALLAERAEVVYDKSLTNPEEIASAINDIGFQAQVLQEASNTLKGWVGGGGQLQLTCASTQPVESHTKLQIGGLLGGSSAEEQIESTLKALPGVLHASFHPATSTCDITYASGQVKLRSLIEALLAVSLPAACWLSFPHSFGGVDLLPQAGFTASLCTDGDEMSDSEKARREELRALRSNLIYR